MKNLRYANFFDHQLLVGISKNSTEMKLHEDSVHKLPILVKGDEIRLVLYDGQQEPEIVAATVLGQDGTIKIERGLEGTTAQAWIAGTRVRLGVTAAMLDGLSALIEQIALQSDFGPIETYLNQLISSVDIVKQASGGLVFYKGKGANDSAELIVGSEVFVSEETVNGLDTVTLHLEDVMPFLAAQTETGDDDDEKSSPTTPADYSFTVIRTNTLEAGRPASVENEGTDQDIKLVFGIPKGAQGDKGSSGNDGSDGADGADGKAASVAVGNVKSLSAGQTPTVTNSGNSTAAVLNFGIPQGAKGEKGSTGNNGQAATIRVGNVTTGSAGSSATVTNSGTEQNVVLDFSIPRGAKGQDGSDGADGSDGSSGSSESSTLDVVTESGTSLSTANRSSGQYIRTSSDNAVDFAVDADSSKPIGWTVTIVQAGSGAVSFTEGDGVTINKSPDSKAQSGGKFTPITLVKAADNSYDLFGGLAAQ